MSITTQRGDDGSTELMFGRRVSKIHPRVVAAGEIDELNAALGLARGFSQHDRVTTALAARQEELVGLMGEIATLPEDHERYAAAGYARVTDDTVAALTQDAAAWETELATRWRDWAVPGADTTPCGAALDLARAVCRRAERAVVALTENASPIPPAALAYLNRLSDWLWLLARWEAKARS